MDVMKQKGDSPFYKSEIAGMIRTNSHALPASTGSKENPY
jgi:hypothetical protein